MVPVLSADRESLGYRVRRLRISERLTRRKVAQMAGVSINEVSLLEHNLPVPLDSKRRLLRELWARRPVRC